MKAPTQQSDLAQDGKPGAFSRRGFIKAAAGGLAALVVGRAIPGISDNPAYGAVAVQSLTFRITDAIKEMVTHNAVNNATCYFWLFKEDRFEAEVPGPNVFTTQGEVINISITNELDEPHAFFIPGMFDSGPIAPGGTFSGSFTATQAGTFLYEDNLNPPVNRVMGLHGAFIVMPRAPIGTHKFTPYALPTAEVQQLFDDLGTAHFPGLSWQDADPATHTLPFRQHIWLLHEASPVLFEEVGRLGNGNIFDAATFVQRFRNDPFIATGTGGITAFNALPQYFTIAGQSGHFVHHNPLITPWHRVGEPSIIRILNAGLWTHSLHIHANHVYLLSFNGAVQKNAIWVDTFTANPGDVFDWLLPMIRPPEVPNTRGIGLADPPLISRAGLPVWPPVEELGLFFPPVGTIVGGVDLAVQLSPLCFPMHDHTEATQTAQGGNYTVGMISGLNFTGDRNTAGGVTTFPGAEFAVAFGITGPAAEMQEGHPI